MECKQLACECCTRPFGMGITAEITSVDGRRDSRRFVVTAVQGAAAATGKIRVGYELVKV